jgi:molybdenum-dependent DNA-binding transcriptional regulator ModE
VKRPLDAEVTRARRRRDRLAAQLAAEDAALEALLKAQRELLEAVVQHQHRVLDLHTDVDSSTVKHMDTAISQKRIGRPITSKHPFVTRAIQLHGSIKAAAEKLDVSPSTARSWYAEGEDGRPISETMVERLAKRPWSIPRSAWRAIK